MRGKGHLNVGYIDDSYLQRENIEDCQANISDNCDLFLKLGFISNYLSTCRRSFDMLCNLAYVQNVSTTDFEWMNDFT